MDMSEEKRRLEEDSKLEKHWRRWGPYLSERQWATVREDYSEDGDAWSYFTHDQARSRAYRWGEDGIAGISDNHQRLCFALAFWNGEDPILKERLFGLTGKEGNHGEDVKEYYFYLDNTPTHSYMRYLYKYPQAAFPYAKLVEENKKRTQSEREYELLDTGIFEKSRYFDIDIEYAKESPENLLIRITIANRGDVAKTIHLLPTLWFRNTWSWTEKPVNKPLIKAGGGCLEAIHPDLGRRFLYFEDGAQTLFTENETNAKRLFGKPNSSPYVKDAFHEYLIHKNSTAINPSHSGTKSALHFVREVAPGASIEVKLRLTSEKGVKRPFEKFEEWMKKRKEEADAFYLELADPHLTQELRQIQRQALAGMLWNKQFYHYAVEDWLSRDPLALGERPKRKIGRNADWVHIYNDDVHSTPDKWEYPGFFSWDTAFHTLPLAMIDPEYAKKQLLLLTREWYMHPNGQLPAYEWSFGDVNPPVHAWATWRVYKIGEKLHGNQDRFFLERVFQKLLMNFTWWVNRKDAEGRNIFQGGFLGMDNISVFNRSEHLPNGGTLYQSDATSWMGMYCLNMLTISLELAHENPSYEDMASKFLEHFLYISNAINHKSSDRLPLWDEEDGFYYDLLMLPDGTHHHLKVRSMVSIVPLFAVAAVPKEIFEKFKGFNKRLEWFLDNRLDLCDKVACMRTTGVEERRLFSIMNRERLKRVLEKMLDESEFLSPYGIRSLSKYHEKHPYVLKLNSHEYTVAYEPAESTSRLFGGNSNWRGPIWFPLNMLIIESLQKFHYYLGDEYKVECPTGSGKMMTLWEVASEIANRLVRMFLMDSNGHRPIYGGNTTFQDDPYWKDHLLFNEYFHGDNGSGIGASHQTGWTGLVAKLIQQLGHYQGMSTTWQ
ncbi:MAG: glucosidase [Chlamydiales bacterium]|nr:glucosidase [Chlamydiales bacterium]